MHTHLLRYDLFHTVKYNIIILIINLIYGLLLIILRIDYGEKLLNRPVIFALDRIPIGTGIFNGIVST